MDDVITVGLDGTAESLAAALWAAREAQACGGKLRMLHARVLLGTEQGGADDEEWDRWTKKITEEAARLLTEEYPRLGISTVLAVGDPEEVLLTAAEESRMLVLGSQGLGRVASYVLGAVGLRVVARSVAPTVLVRAADGHVGAGPEPSDSSVLLGASLDEEAEDVWAFAFAYADRHGLGVHAVHARQLPPYAHAAQSTAPAPRLVEGAVYQAERELNALLAPWREKYPRVRVRGSVRVDSASRALTRESARASVLVVGRRARPGSLGPQVGHVLQAVAHHAPCPLAVVPHR
ncbi:hypothetical protein DUI70_3197 [Streptomyces albus]|uniref:universal stress protein n=1 Tax=Streptomyces physcomitrii TaxID=2724184 RepID=UPI000590723F|nr:hypothetical protein DUI70_3197 [Streptomyces albus]